jgi:hypothetical protein
MRRQMLNRLSQTEREKLNRQLRTHWTLDWFDLVAANLDRRFLFVRKVDGSLRLCIAYKDLNEAN